MREKELLKRVLLLVKPHTRRLSIAVVSMVVVAVLSAGQAYMVKPLLDEIFFKKNELLLNLLPLALLLLFLVKGVFYYCYSYLLERAGQHIVRDLRNRMYNHLQSLPLSYFNKTPTGELISRIMADVSLIQMAVATALIGIMKDFFQIICLLAVIFYQNWKLALISIIFIPLATAPIIYFGKKYRSISTSTQQTLALSSSILHEAITGNRIVKAFCTEQHELKRFSTMIDKLLSFTIRDAQLRSLSHPLMEFLGGIGIALIIWYGGNEVLNGTATPGTFFSFLTALIMIYEPIKKVSSINNTFQQGLAAASRIFGLLDTKVEITDKPDAKTLPPLRKKIDLVDVCFSYDDTEQILKNINLSINSGEVIAFVGPSGGGKTTLVNLLPRFYEVTQGAILVDGSDIRDVSLKSLRNQIGIVTQQTILFNDTVRNNIAYGDHSRSDEEIIAAAKSAHCLDFINDLPQGFDTIIGEGGSRLSGGQQQRLSIARALLKNAPILILDEATSALDTVSERKVQTALENLMKERTTFVIAHRLSTIKNADRIIVIEKGQILEEGTHQGLIEKNGIYKNLYHFQSHK